MRWITWCLCFSVVGAQYFSGGPFAGNSLAMKTQCNNLQPFSGASFAGNTMQSKSQCKTLKVFQGSHFAGNATQTNSQCKTLTLFQGGNLAGNFSEIHSQCASLKVFQGGGLSGQHSSAKAQCTPLLVFQGGIEGGYSSYEICDFTVGVVTKEVSSDFIVAPNPAHYSLYVKGCCFKKPIIITLFSVEGKKLYHTKIPLQSEGKFYHHIDVQSLPNGIYTLVVQSGEAFKTFRILILH